MSTQPPLNNAAEIGQLIHYDETVWLVVRIVESTSFFETAEGECYLLEEKYAELRHISSSAIAFKTFSQIKHPFTKAPHVVQRGLDPKVWKRY